MIPHNEYPLRGKLKIHKTACQVSLLEEINFDRMTFPGARDNTFVCFVNRNIRVKRNEGEW